MAQTEVSWRYLVCPQGNFLAVFRAGENTPFVITQIDLRLMRRADRAAFTAGVHLHSDEELARLLEDYDQ